MPVRKLRSLDDAEAACWSDPKDPLLWSRIAAVWKAAARLTPPRHFPPGVYKHCSIRELNQRTEDWERQRARR